MRKASLFEHIFNSLSNNEIPRVDLHVHTNWTDGQQTVKEMHAEACKKSLSHIFFSEHSRKESGNWFLDFIKEVKALSKEKCEAISGTEVKILNFDGDLDLTEAFYKASDLIMASVHRFPGETSEDFKRNDAYSEDKVIKMEFDLMMSALENPKVDILGHPFGMSIKRFGYDPSEKLFDEVIKKCKKNDKVFEVNYRYHKNPKLLIGKCITNSTKISLGSNAHSKSELGKIIENI
tara:strand:+ start:392 stop:1096 length:705 start_codon:yes stop_codon:yes gene_type:complete